MDGMLGTQSWERVGVVEKTEKLLLDMGSRKEVEVNYGYRFLSHLS